MKKIDVLRKVMVAMICAVMVSFVGVSCTDEVTEAVKDLFGWDRNLAHDIDNDETRASDNMRANIIFTENDKETSLASSPAMETSIRLAKSQIEVAEAKNAGRLLPDSVKYDGKQWGSLSATDNSTLYWYLPGGQTVTVPVNITALRTNYKGKMYHYGTDSLISSSLSVKFEKVSTRAGSSTEQYNAVYEADLTFKEVNAKDSVFTVKLRAKALASIIDDEPEPEPEPNDTAFAGKGYWVWKSDSTYTWDFDKYKVVGNDTTITHMSIPAGYRIKGLDPWEKIVKTFSYKLDFSNGWNYGAGERKVASSMDYVTIYEKSEDHYGATIVNIDDNDKIVTDYTAVLQRVVYDDGEVRSEAKYPEVKANEANTFVKMLAESAKDGYDAALLTNSVDFTILEHVQRISEEVTLYVQKNMVIKREIADAVLKVFDDYVETSLTYKETYLNGDVKEYKDKRSFARVRRTMSNWMATEQYYSVMTDAAKVALTATEAMEDGYWSWVNETRDITTDAHLYASTQTNKWREMVANSITYTRDGIKHEFGKLEYVAVEAGQKVNSVSADEYAYKDSISIKYDDNKVGITAPGKIKLTGKEVKGYENRNGNVEVVSDSVIASVDHVTMFTDVTEDADHVSHSFPRVRTAGPAWQSYESNGNENTDNPTTASTH